jgi:Uncharacterized conserved protein
VSEADPAPFLHECYEAINDESPVKQDSHDYSDGNHDGDELSREEIEDALEHVDSSCSYPEWRDMLFAIHDWDASSTGKQVAESWSMGPGWDDQAEKYIEQIWSGAEQGDGITVGTLIHRANENGWTSSPDTPEVQGATHETNTDGGEDADTDETDDGTFTWDMVYNGYQNANKADERMPYRYGATEIMSREDHWRNVAETDILWRYVHPNGDPDRTAGVFKQTRAVLSEQVGRQTA